MKLKIRIFCITAMLLILIFSAMIAILPTVSAHTPPISVPTYAYLSISPNPVGVNQQAFLIMWIHGAPPTANGIAGDLYHDFTIEITKPDGTTQKLGPFTSDATGSTYALYTPNQIGTYTFVFKYSGQVISLYNPKNGLPGSNSDYINDTWLPSQTTATLTVQQNQVVAVEDYSLPTSYWTRPIEAQNTRWATIASNWLGGSYLGTTNARYQTGIGPNSAHIMWTKPIEFGGVVGGITEIPGVGFYSGGAYEGRFTNAMIIAGKLYFWQPLNHASGDRTSASKYLCVDLQTGEEQWVSDEVGIIGVQTYPNNIRPTMKGQLFNYESMNQHGVVGGVLWEVVDTNWIAWDAYTGEWLYNLTKVPTGTEEYTAKGEIVRYVLNYNRNTKSGWLALWNSSQDNMGLAGEIGTSSAAYQWRPVGKTVDMSKAYSWNVTLSADLSGLSAPSIVDVLPGDIILGTSTSYGRLGTVNPYTIWAISDKPTTRGQLLWIKNYSAPANYISRGMGIVDPVNRVFTMQDAETMSWLGYNLDTGAYLWGPTTYATRAFSYYGSGGGAGQVGFAAYGNLYVQGYGGELICYDTKDGSLVWKFNNTNSGLDTPWGLRPIFVAAIADGKVYAFNNEHSPNTPLYKGQKLYCIDAYTGNELWTMQSWVGQTGGGGTSTSVLADGYFAYYNYYDAQIYCVGKGPSTITVQAPLAGISLGQSLIIQGTVADVSAGAKAKVESGEFSIVPAISDASMASWMEYTYMQKPMPTDATGVPVNIFATDANGSTQQIATVTSDSSGLFYYRWVPSQTGTYEITVAFDGSNSYWSSSATTAISVDAAQATTTQTPTPTQTPAETQTPAPTTTISASPTVAPTPGTGISTETLLIAGAAVIIIIAVIAAALVLRKRK